MWVIKMENPKYPDDIKNTKEYLDPTFPALPSLLNFHSGLLNDLSDFIENVSRYIVLKLIVFIGYIFQQDRWSPFLEKERWVLQFNNRRIFTFLFSLLWTIVLWFGVLYKCFYESVTDFISYFTNISFAYQAVYFLLYTLSFLEDPRKRRLEFFVLFGFFWNMFAQVCNVFILVLGVFLDAPGLVISETKTGGGDYDDGVVLVAERLYHVIPLMVALIIIFLCWIDISDILILMFAKVYCLPKYYKGEKLCSHSRCAFKVDIKQAWCYILFNYIMAFVPLLLYYNIVDLRTIYKLHDFPTYAAFLVMIGINAFSVVIPLCFQFYSTIPGREVPTELVAYDDYQKVVVIPNGVPLPS